MANLNKSDFQTKCVCIQAESGATKYDSRRGCGTSTEERLDDSWSVSKSADFSDCPAE